MLSVDQMKVNLSRTNSIYKNEDKSEFIVINKMNNKQQNKK